MSESNKQILMKQIIKTQWRVYAKEIQESLERAPSGRNGIISVTKINEVVLDCNPKYEDPKSVEMGNRQIFQVEEFHVMHAAALS